MQIALFYGSSTCYTEIAAEKIRDYFADNWIITLPLYNVANDSLELMADYDYLILGIPTWDYGELQEDWELVWPQLRTLDLHGKKVALYGCGDQLGYPEWFQDAMGYLHKEVVEQGAEVCGYWPVEGYEFESSMALTADGTHFVGLSLDEDSQFELSDQRIADWCQQIYREFLE